MRARDLKPLIADDDPEWARLPATCRHVLNLAKRLNELLAIMQAWEERYVAQPTIPPRDFLAPPWCNEHDQVYGMSPCDCEFKRVKAEIEARQPAEGMVP